MIRRVLLDDDIILDILLDRDPFVQVSVEICNLIESKKIEGYVTPITLNKIFNVGKQNGGVEIAWQAIAEIRTILKV
ncbi:PIN domain-containing protein [Anabaena sp. 90]|uniref:PIN domain-containing protein n=2 Tax=Nostocales TaxID=1161 RepID=UPI0002F5BA98|nr:PIN domain-containing protein [Anabaena sp. 90]